MQLPVPETWRPTARTVAPYAVDASKSLGRLHAEPACPMRTPFQRDRDRIVHATAFRRLNYKTQVFLFHEGDHYRSRLTHSLEVAQIARALARQLVLDEDLAEALALAHDLGHPPFGHAGERALDRVLGPSGGFDHNAQSLKVVTALERKYTGFDGLNLAFETLDGLVKHNGPIEGPKAQGGDGARLLQAAIDAAGLGGRLDLAHFASAEAQVAALADDIAWHNHDVDDGLRAGLLHLEQLAEAPLVGPYVAEALARVGGGEQRRVIYEVNRRLITAMIVDCVAETRGRLAELQPQSAEVIRRAERPMVAFSDSVVRDLAGLKAYLFTNVYRHPRVTSVMNAAEGILVDLFHCYRHEPEALPDNRGQALAGLAAVDQARRIGDFMAGMTDRYAIAEHRRLFDVTPELG